jgi:hypothetical protein
MLRYLPALTTTFRITTAAPGVCSAAVDVFHAPGATRDKWTHEHALAVCAERWAEERALLASMFVVLPITSECLADGEVHYRRRERDLWVRIERGLMCPRSLFMAYFGDAVVQRLERKGATDRVELGPVGVCSVQDFARLTAMFAALPREARHEWFATAASLAGMLPQEVALSGAARVALALGALLRANSGTALALPGGLPTIQGGAHPDYRYYFPVWSGLL